MAHPRKSPVWAAEVLMSIVAIIFAAAIFGAVVAVFIEWLSEK